MPDDIEVGQQRLLFNRFLKVVFAKMPLAEGMKLAYALGGLLLAHGEQSDRTAIAASALAGSGNP